MAPPPNVSMLNLPMFSQHGHNEPYCRASARLPQYVPQGPPSKGSFSFPSSHGGSEFPALLNNGSAGRGGSPTAPPTRAAPGETRSASKLSAAGGIGNAVCPGDVIYVRGTATGIWQIGAAGGFMGHVVVAIGRPELLPCHSDEHRALQEVFTSELPELWRIPTVESTRGQEGLHYAHLVIYADARTGRLRLAGELSNDRSELFALNSKEEVQLWQSPAEIRDLVTPELVASVLSDMEDDEEDWSYTTAFRAMFLDAHSFSARGRGQKLSEIKACWKSKPICTSVVISFWQRLLCCVSSEQHRNSPREGSDPALQEPALKLIFRWMPLKADRGLPGELLESMHDCGWHMLKAVH